MKVQILSRKLVKPSTQTPHSLRNYKISLLDELAPAMSVPLILFYPAPAKNDGLAKNANSLLNRLEISLSQTLTHFYPIAGRYIKETRVVDCSDQGVEYVEARVSVQLVELLTQLGAKAIKLELLNQLIPGEVVGADEPEDPLLAIQISFFKCGGVAIGVSISHRIADTSTLSTFISVWASTSRGGNSTNVIQPSFNLAAFLPGRNLPPPPYLESPITTCNNGTTSRIFSFTGKAISTLRSTQLASKGGQLPSTRVQLVLAIIWRALVGIAQAKHGHPRASCAILAVNLRERTIPPMPKHSCGNFVGIAIAKRSADHEMISSKMELQGFVDPIGAAIRNTVTDCASMLSEHKDGLEKIINPFMEMSQNSGSSAEMDVCIFTSWCKFPFYQNDFGWGLPLWISVAITDPVKNSVCLMDNKEGDGIEAWVYLDEEDMVCFQQDQTIQAFTT